MPAALAAFSARRAPSRAGTISSSSLFGALLGSGEATWATWLHPAIASAQPASPVRSAAKNFSLLSSTARLARTVASLARSRIEVWTVQPSAINWRIRNPAM